MAKKNQHVIPHGGEWAIKGEGNKKETEVTQTKKEAEKIEREIAKKSKSELFIHDKEWKTINRSNFGNDPYPSVDEKH